MELLIIALVLFTFGITSQKLHGTSITPTMIAVLMGFTAGPSGLNLFAFPMNLDIPLIQSLLKITLVIVLFSDAASTKFPSVNQNQKITFRMLFVGVPAAIFFGTIIAKFLFPSQTYWDAALLAAILACTDAALARAVVEAPEMPLEDRQVLRIESGLNDGLVLPVILFLGICDSIWAGVEYAGFWLWFSLMQFGFGIPIGIAVGYFASIFFQSSCKKNVTPLIHLYAGAAFALLAYTLAEAVHGNGFISAFIAGLTLNNSKKSFPDKCQEGNEAISDLLSLTTFFLFGALVVIPNLREVTPQIVLYSLLSLIMIRPLAIASSLYGLSIPKARILILGWFGPRGIASLLFVLLVMQDFPIAANTTLVTTVTLTVFISILLHGFSAIPITRWYCQKVD